MSSSTPQLDIISFYYVATRTGMIGQPIHKYLLNPSIRHHVQILGKGDRLNAFLIDAQQ